MDNNQPFLIAHGLLILFMVSNSTETHYIDVIMSAMSFQITSITIVYSTVYSGADQEIHRWPVNSPYKGPVTRKMSQFDDVIMSLGRRFIIVVPGAPLTHWGRVTHICVGNLTIIGSDNGLSPGRRQAITWTNVGILLIGPLGTNISEMLIVIHTRSFKKIHLKMSSGKWRPFCLGLNVLTPV